MKKKNNTINLENFPINSSLGHLAYGDLAFAKWREIKKEHNRKLNEKK
jgi:hypothetical protein